MSADALQKIATLLEGAIQDSNITITNLKNEAVLVAVYDFAKYGGAIGDIPLLSVPANMVVWDGFIYTKTAPVGTNATIRLSLEATGDILAATAITSFTAGSRLAAVPVGTAATSVVTTQERNLVMAIATTALTAGKFACVLRGMHLPL